MFHNTQILLGASLPIVQGVIPTIIHRRIFNERMLKIILRVIIIVIEMINLIILIYLRLRCRSRIPYSSMYLHCMHASSRKNTMYMNYVDVNKREGVVRDEAGN